jgi:hypothetical protein
MILTVETMHANNDAHDGIGYLLWQKNENHHAVNDRRRRHDATFGLNNGGIVLATSKQQ